MTGSRASAGRSFELSSLSKALPDSHEDNYFVPPSTTPAEKTAQQIQQLGISPLTVISDFLASVRKVTIDSIERTYETKWVRESKIEYVLTVPAIWSDAAKDSMVQAAQKAGFGKHRRDFNLIGEPESAAGGLPLCRVRCWQLT
jgi:molecular chaperone DnaK (HSP70)